LSNTVRFQSTLTINQPDGKAFQQVAQTLNVPAWFLEQLAVERLECRDYVAYPGFAFDNISEEQLRALLATPVLVVGGPVHANVHRDTLASRLISALGGRPVAPLVDDGTVLIPEGKIPVHHVPAFDNPLSVSDPKISFGSHIQVFDEGSLWQWRIATFATVEGRNYGKWVSDEIDLDPLDAVTPRFRETDAMRAANGGRYPDGVLREFHIWLESIRAPLRTQLMELHYAKKAALPPSSAVVSVAPPLLSSFETFSVEEGKMRTRFDAAPILFRAMVRHCRRATELNTTRNSFLDEQYTERIEAVISGAACLEALVNTVGVRIVPDWQENFDHLPPTEKWLQCHKQRGKDGLFDLGRQPYQSFAKLISLRNTWMHHKPIDEEVKQAGRDGKTTIERNVGSRFISELPAQMRTLICDLFTAIGEEPPYWLNARPGWDV
jgi:hypothetical protein